MVIILVLDGAGYESEDNLSLQAPSLLFLEVLEHARRENLWTTLTKDRKKSFLLHVLGKR